MILDGTKLKQEILKDLQVKINNLNYPLSLAVIQVGNDESSTVYIKQKEKMCKQLNINFYHYHFDGNQENDILKLINELNNNHEINGILLQLPIPKTLDKVKLQNAISYEKDVDGLTKENVYRLLNQEPGLLPCTAKGIIILLDYYNCDVVGKNVVVVGRSNLVGKPIANLLLNRDANITICHSKTKDLQSYTKNADILVSATGVAHLIKSDMVKENSIIIDVGINRYDGKLVGDVDFENILDKVEYITPVPGGVGPMTIASLAQNIYEAALLQNKNS